MLNIPAPASAVTINDLFVFGDSYSDTGAFFPLTNGSTAVGYLAKNFNITLTTSKNADPGTEGVNFAESGARIFVGPTPPATQPRSLTQQVAEFQNSVTSNLVTFNPSTTLFFLSGGLNDHNRITPEQANAATTAQVATLYSLGRSSVRDRLASVARSCLQRQRADALQNMSQFEWNEQFRSDIAQSAP
jgi:phospholipase/lecithinase/hemolysin